MRWPFLSLAVVLGLLVAAAAHADAVADARAAEAAIARGDLNEAARLYRKAADQGDANAQYNFTEAARLYRKAADQGDAKARYNLGAMYREGQGVPLDNAEAVRWFRKAADQGDARGQFNLGVMYRDGQGVPKDLVQAKLWVSLSVENLQGEERVKAQRDSDFIASKLTPAQSAEAEKLVREWKAKP